VETGSSPPNLQLTALRDCVERMLDSEKLLPADGEALLNMLRQAEERIEAKEYGAAVGLLLGFESLLQALGDSGVLDPKSSEICVVMARTAAEAINAS
jgi:hypothetical protein